MKKIIELLKKVSILVLTSVMILGTLMTNTTGSVKALYDGAGNLVGHGYDALSTKNGLNPVDKGVITRSVEASDFDYKDDWIQTLQFTDQNGDPENGTAATLYPGETLHVKYTVQYTGKSALGGGVTLKRLWNSEFIQFKKTFFDYTGNVKVTSTNPQNKPTLSFWDNGVGFYVGTFSAVSIKPNDTITIEFDAQASPDLKEGVQDFFGTFPQRANIDVALFAQYPGDRISLLSGIGWTQSETPIEVSKKVNATTNKNVDETPTHPIVDLTGDEVEYEIELNNNLKGSQFAQIVRDSLFEKLPSTASDIRVTSIERIHQAQNPLVDYVELSMDKGTPITTNSVATQDQLDAVTAKLKAGTFVVDEIQEGDKVLIKYKVTVPRAQDSDADGITDQQELLYVMQGLDPMNACSLSWVKPVPNPDEDPSDPSDDMIYDCKTAAVNGVTVVDGVLDSDDDGRINAEETTNDLNPFNPDENGNGILDGLEDFKTGLNNDFIYDKNGSKKSTSTPYSGYPSVKKTSKTENGDKLIEPGEKIDYTIELANFTSGTAYDIPVRDSLYETLSSGSQYGFSLVPGYTVVDEHGNVLTTSGNLADGTLKVEKLLTGEKAFLQFSTKASNNIEDLIGNGASRLTNVVTIDGTTPTTSDNTNGKYSTTDAKASDKIAVGKVSLHKVDETSKAALAGAEFAILDKNDVDVKHITTDANGDAETLLVYGDYKLVEVKAPAGYKLDSTPQPFTVDLTNETITKTIDNAKIQVGKIEITKQDKTDGTKLAGAVFEVRDGAGTVMDTLTTDPTGKATSVNLPLGNYTLVETVAPAGYDLDPTAIPVALTTNGVTVTKTIDNTKTPQVGKIEITKQDKTDGTKLAGAVFDVRDGAGTVMDTLITDPTGKATSVDLPLGNYALVETKAPTGYDLDPTAISVALTTNGVTVTKTIDNTKTPVIPQVGKIEITKQDKADGIKLAGAVFEVRDGAGTVMDTLTTDPTGKATSVNLPLGNYTLVETVAPNGYGLDPTAIPVTLTTNGVTVTKTIDNTKTPQVGKIEITKQDKADGTKLAGAEFDVRDGAGTVMDTLITDPTGKATSVDLPLGNYTLVETKAPTGYDLDPTAIPVALTTNGVTVTKTIDNTKTPVIPQVGKIEITKQDKTDGTKLAGAVFEVRDGAGTVMDTLITDPTGKATSVNLPLGNYILVETVAPNGYDLDPTAIPVTILTNGQVVTKTIDNTKTPQVGKIEITKQDKADGTKLAGAVFEVRDGAGTVMDTLTTDPTGKTTSVNLPLGNYTLVETVAPAGYDLDSTAIPVALTTNGVTVTKTIDNTKTPVIPQVGKIEITKQDKADGTKLAGAEFDVRDGAGTVMDTLITDPTGKATSVDLPLGNYTLVETKAPNGYDLDPTAISIALTTNGVTVTKTIDNTKTPVIPQVGKIEITKQDKADGTKLAGAVFEVRDGAGTVMDTLITNPTGKATTKELPIGTYTLVETKAPAGYTLDATPISVTIAINGQVVTKTIDNTKTPVVPQVGKIEITKQDKADGAKLAGAEFDIKDTSGAVVAHVVTDATGKAITKELPLGTYTLVETKAPVGYTLNSNPIPVTISTNGQVITKTIDNTKTPVIPQVGKIEITKQDKADGTKLAGAEFDIKDTSGAVVAHVVTDATGKAITKELPLGTYTIVETKAPNGYQLDDTPIPVSITMANQVVKQAVTNKSISNGTVYFKGFEIIKQDKANNTKLAGAEFDVKDEKGTVVDHVVTDNTGKAKTKSLPLGNYTLVETKAPSGYKLDATPISVTGKTKDETVPVTVTNEKIVGTITVSKFDKKTGNRLSGMTFTIRNVQTGESRLIAMNEYNVMNVTDLPLGTYEITEVTAPKGYEIDPTTYTIEVTADAYNKTLDIYDVAKPGTPTAPVEPTKSGTTSFTKSPKPDGETVLLPDTGNGNPNNIAGIISIVLFTSVVLLAALLRRQDNSNI